MALSFAVTNPNFQGLSLGNLNARLVTVTFDSSYATDGESLTAADVGLSQIFAVFISPDANADLPYVIQYDYTASKLLVYGVEQDADAATIDPLDQESSATDLSTLVVRCLVLGI